MAHGQRFPLVLRQQLASLECVSNFPPIHPRFGQFLQIAVPEPEGGHVVFRGGRYGGEEGLPDALPGILSKLFVT